MALEELQHEARQDLAVIDQERLDQESLKNQTIKAKWLEHRTCLLYTSPSPRDPE